MYATTSSVDRVKAKKVKSSFRKKAHPAEEIISAIHGASSLRGTPRTVQTCTTFWPQPNHFHGMEGITL